MKVKLGGYYLMKSGDIVMIAQVGAHKFMAISLTDQNRWSDTIVNGKMGAVVEGGSFDMGKCDDFLSEVSLKIEATQKTPSPVFLEIP